MQPFTKHLNKGNGINHKDHMRFEVLMVMKIQIVVFWVVMQCSNVVEYQCFE